MPSSEYSSGEESSLREPVVSHTDITPATDTGSQSEPTSGDTRWDHDKAESVASVLPDTAEGWKYLSGQIDEELAPERLQQRQGYIEGIQDEIKAKQQELEGQKEGTIGHSIKSEDLSNLRGRKFEAENFTADQVSLARRELHSGAEDVLPGIEKLFDTDPERFNAMPTHEFLALAKEFLKAEQTVDGIEWHIDVLQRTKGTIDNRILQRDYHVIYAETGLGDDIKALKKYGGVTIDEEGEFIDSQVDAQVSELFKRESLFDKTPHEILTELSRISEAAIEDLSTHVLPAEVAKRDRLLQSTDRTSQPAPESQPK